ncbi:HAD-IA family hydrolase [Yoonia sp. 2307UL14-13]|uniref:HAD-IA family hydrolase n=1 Tax=Yoonia sp. 2307UL14-13 TaxID=3126506 RepID=UPI0030A4BB3F
MVNAEKPVLLVDVDGVLIFPNDPDATHWTANLKRDVGFERKALSDHFFRPFWKDIVTGKDTLMPRLEQALQAMGSTVKATDLRDYWFANDARRNVPLIAWVDAQRDAGHRVMLATNQEHERAAYIMDTIGLSAHCDGIYYSAALGMAKPNALFFHEISKREGRPLQDMIFIDDTKANVEAARAEGLLAIHYTGQPPDQLTTAIVSGDA